MYGKDIKKDFLNMIFVLGIRDVCIKYYLERKFKVILILGMYVIIKIIFMMYYIYNYYVNIRNKYIVNKIWFRL